jgi:hypothetical protein
MLARHKVHLDMVVYHVLYREHARLDAQTVTNVLLNDYLSFWSYLCRHV